MGTSCVIGYGPRDKFKGIYVHYDGNIENAGMQLVLFLVIHGFLSLKQLILSHKEGMSAFNVEPDLSLKKDFLNSTAVGRYYDYEDMGNVSYFYDVAPKRIHVYKSRQLIKTIKIEGKQQIIIKSIFEAKKSDVEHFTYEIGQKMLAMI